MGVTLSAEPGVIPEHILEDTWPEISIAKGYFLISIALAHKTTVIYQIYNSL